MKVCSKCKEEKEFINFSKNKTRKDGYDNNCKSCVKQLYQKNKQKISERQRQYRQENKENIRKYRKKYDQENKEKIKEQQKQYRESNKEKRNSHVRQRRKEDPMFKLICHIRSLIGNSIKKQGYTKNSKTFEILGCSYEEFKLHIEKQFKNGMSWNNAGEWHYDHIYPISLAKTQEEIIKLNHYTNFQPLWAKENISKGNRVI